MARTLSDKWLGDRLWREASIGCCRGGAGHGFKFSKPPNQAQKNRTRTTDKGQTHFQYGRRPRHSSREVLG